MPDHDPLDMSNRERDGNERRGTGASRPVTLPPTPARGALLVRGLTRRCPMCGGRGLFPKWFTMRERCPTCGLRLDRGEHDFWAGAWMLNIVGVETVFVLLVALGVVVAWPDVSWTLVTWLGVAGMLALPLLLFPTSRTLWLAIDLAIQPARDSDYGS